MVSNGGLTLAPQISHKVAFGDFQRNLLVLHLHDPVSTLVVHMHNLNPLRANHKKPNEVNPAI